jgi:uncharacterized protein
MAYMIRFFGLLFALSGSFLPIPATAQADIEINTPGVASVKQSMQQRHNLLEKYYEDGTIGLTQDGLVAIRDVSSVPLATRQTINALVAAENKDRNALYREIARANGHPEWEEDIRSTFGQRWIERARPGWWYQAHGSWIRK